MGSLLRGRQRGPGAQIGVRGAQKRGPVDEPRDHALGRSRGGFSTKLHIVGDGAGLPIAIEVSPGQSHESTWVIPLLDSVRVRSSGAPKRRPEKLAGDKGYSSGPIRDWLKAHRITPVIAHRQDESGREDESFDRQAYRDRNVIERCIGWIKELRRIATRYEKLAVNYLGMLKLGMIRQYLKTASMDLSDRA